MNCKNQSRLQTLMPNIGLLPITHLIPSSTTRPYLQQASHIFDLPLYHQLAPGKDKCPKSHPVQCRGRCLVQDVFDLADRYGRVRLVELCIGVEGKDQTLKLF